MVRGRKGTQQKELDAARRSGYVRVRVDGNMYELDEEIKLEKNIKHTMEIVVDRLVDQRGRAQPSGRFHRDRPRPDGRSGDHRRHRRRGR